MKSIVTSLFALFAMSVAAVAGVTYDFTSETTGLANQTLAGKVKAEGTRIRVDIDRGDGVLFENGSFIVSSDGGKTLTVANPDAKTFYQIDLGQLLGGSDTLLKSLGANIKLNIRNPKVSVTDGGGGGTLEGFATKKSTLMSAYEIAVEGLGMPMVITMNLSTEVWWTDRISSSFTNFLQLRGLRTGVDAVDKMIEAQAGAIEGFPLKQVTTTRVSFGGKDMTTTSTSLVTNVKETAVAQETFVVPAGFTKTDSPIDRMIKGMQSR